MPQRTKLLILKINNKCTSVVRRNEYRYCNPVIYTRENRFCFHCNPTCIKDRKHFLLDCPRYEHVRKNYLKFFIMCT